MEKRFRSAFVRVLLICLTVLCVFAVESNSFAAKDSLNFGTASIGGVYYIWGGAVANLLTNKGVANITAEVTGGPVQNVTLVNADLQQFACASVGPVWEGFHGQGWAKKKYPDIRAMMPMYPSYYHFYTPKKRGINDVWDFKGRVAGLNPAGSTPDVYTRRLFEVLDIKPKKMLNAGATDQAAGMRDGIIDFVAAFTSLPNPTVLELEATTDMKVFGLSGKARDTFLSKYPFFAQSKIPKGVHKSVREPMDTLTMWNIIIVNKDVPEQLVYKMLDTVFSNNSMLKDIHNSFRDLTASSMTDAAVIPLHKGAFKYYRDKGITIPEKAKPID
jgi:uncharacterized protein